ncbi:MAG: cob(I)yrinic acid a,c-diamide adenosyltransferase [Patescibacteria group bacterium]|nr:cob(I)yrinic acid a,c-diamide adenosyltransferase [Patescibacteria group bacterium]
MSDEREIRWGLIQVFTGDGRGKTSAALGTALRAAAQGRRCAIVYFDKGGESHYSERLILRERIPEIEIFPTGLDRIDEKGRFRFGVTDEDRAEGERGINIIREIFSAASYDLVVLDEINPSTHLGIVEEANILDLLKSKPDNLEMILTGRNAPQSFLDLADLVTEMGLKKHYFYRGVKAREGLDY